MRKFMQCMLLALLALGFMPAAHAADPYLETNGPLPTAESPPVGQWTTMRPASHEATGDGAAEQCERNRLAGLIALSAQQCVELGQRFDAGEARVVGVPDGIVFNINNGRRNGVSYTTELVEKQLGRIDRAELLFAGFDEYGNRYYAYFFRGEDTSCNNIVWVILPPETVEVVTYETPPPPPNPRKRCYWLPVNQSEAITMQRYRPGFLLQSCCPTCVGPTFIPGQVVSGTTSGSSTTYGWVCY